MAKDSTESSPDPSDAMDEMRQLRRAALDLGMALRAFGKARLEDVGEEISDDAVAVAREGRRVVREVEERFGQLEKRAEKSLREHPALGQPGFWE